MSTEILEEIRTELKELRLLYKGLIDKLVSEEEPTPDEKEAIEDEDEQTDEEELFEALG